MKDEPSTWDKKKFLAIIILVLTISMMLVYVQTKREMRINDKPTDPTKAQFVLSEIPTDNEYGEGISAVYVHENSTGSWIAVKDPAYFLPSDDTTVDVNAGGLLNITPTPTINHTLRELSTYDEARAIMRLSIEVLNLGEVVFSQQNLTALEDGEGTQTSTTWWIAYVVVVPIVLVAGEIYVVTLTYEIYYSDTPEGETFGYDSEYGGVLLHGVDRLVGCIFTSPSGTGQSIEKITAEVYAESGTVNIKAVIVDVDTMAIVSNGVSTPVTVTTTQHTWYDFSFSTRPEIEGDTDYCLMLIASGSFRFYYGSDSYTSKYDNSNSYTTPQNPGTWSSQSNTGYSIYATLYVTPESEEWHIINAATFTFVIPWDTTTLNAFTIFLGLFMIPASTLYLVKGGKDNLSSDKVFFFIVAFMLGWGLLIGGIYG